MDVVLDSPFSAIETARHLVACFNRDRGAAQLDPNHAFFAVQQDWCFSVFPYGRALYGLEVASAPGGSMVHLVPYVGSISESDTERVRTYIACMSRTGSLSSGEQFAKLCDRRGNTIGG